jgi:ergosteryl-3beta-O-L-aspartate synthase
VSQKNEDEPVKFRARIHYRREIGMLQDFTHFPTPLRKHIGSGIVFLIFRQGTSTIQGVVVEEPGLVSENMVRWARRLHQETIVLVEGTAQIPKGGQDEVRSTTVHKLEVKVHKACTLRPVYHVAANGIGCSDVKLYIVAEPTAPLPFHIIDGSRSIEAFEKV